MAITHGRSRARWPQLTDDPVRCCSRDLKIETHSRPRTTGGWLYTCVGIVAFPVLNRGVLSLDRAHRKGGRAGQSIGGGDGIAFFTWLLLFIVLPQDNELQDFRRDGDVSDLLGADIHFYPFSPDSLPMASDIHLRPVYTLFCNWLLKLATVQEEGDPWSVVVENQKN